MLPLTSLDQRIVIIGPSNAGKSTLAVAVSEKLGLNVIHLDQLRHLPNTDWELRPDEEFAELHDEAVNEENWVIEGNYSRLLPERLERATGVVLVNSGALLRCYRYLRRTLIIGSERAGNLEGTQDSLKWDMIKWILIESRENAAHYAEAVRDFDDASVECHTAAELRKLYKVWVLPLR